MDTTPLSYQLSTTPDLTRDHKPAGNRSFRIIGFTALLLLVALAVAFLLGAGSPLPNERSTDSTSPGLPTHVESSQSTAESLPPASEGGR